MEFASNTRTCPNFSATQLKNPASPTGAPRAPAPSKGLATVGALPQLQAFSKAAWQAHTLSISIILSSIIAPLLQNSIFQWPPNSETNFPPNLVKCTLASVDLAYGIFWFCLRAQGPWNWPWFFTSQVSAISVFSGIRWNRPNSHFAYFTHTSPNMGSPEKGRKKVSKNMHLLISCTMGRFPASK